MAFTADQLFDLAGEVRYWTNYQGLTNDQAEARLKNQGYSPEEIKEIMDVPA